MTPMDEHQQDYNYVGIGLLNFVNDVFYQEIQELQNPNSAWFELIVICLCIGSITLVVSAIYLGKICYDGYKTKREMKESLGILMSMASQKKY